MESLRIDEVINAVQGTLLTGNPETVVTGVCTDSRKLQPGDLFFALTAQRDGHEFVSKAIEGHAAGVVVSDASCVPSDCTAAVVKVDDPLWALGDLASYYRSKFSIRVVGVTGSVGKTTTKEMLACILERKWRILKNELNYNNEIGVPLTLFNLEPSHEVVILEMAMRGLGEIRRLAQIAKPSVGVITNIGMSHIERLGSQGAIADAKSELLTELPEDGLTVLNAEDCYYPVLEERTVSQIISFGSCSGATVIAAGIHAGSDDCYGFTLMVGKDKIPVNLSVLGHHNVFNAIAAAAVAYGMGVDLLTIKAGLESFSPPSMRMEVVSAGGGCVVLNDAYNANPASMSAALRTLRTLSGYKRKIAVLGDMLELGDYAAKAHRDIGSSVAEGGIDMLVTVGPLGELIAGGARESGFSADSIRSYPDSVHAGRELKSLFKKGDVVLVKGSRGIKMEVIVRAIEGE